MATDTDRRYRVERMELLIGNGQTDPRTEPTPGTEGSAAGPSMQAAREFEGQEVTLNELRGMGRFQWEADGVGRLDTASESYRVFLTPCEREQD